MTTTSRKSQCGFSLIEMIIVIVTVGIIAFATAPIFMSGFQAFFWVRDVTDLGGQAELAMDRMAREIRGIDPANITTFTETQLSFNLNGTTPVTYSRDAGQKRLLRTVSGNADLLASNVDSLTFKYIRQWSSAGAITETLQKSEIRWVRFIVSVQASGTQVTETLQTTVFLRSGNKTR
jgi:prepilin-type N-terminal cleavage/methylation domain-containing protein